MAHKESLIDNYAYYEKVSYKKALNKIQFSRSSVFNGQKLLKFPPIRSTTH